MDEEENSQIQSANPENEFANNYHLFEVHKHNAKEMYPIIKALMFRDVRILLFLIFF